MLLILTKNESVYHNPEIGRLAVPIDGRLAYVLAV